MRKRPNFKFTPERTFRVALVLATLNAGGAEKWLLDMITASKARFGKGIAFDLITLLGPKGVLERELLELGCGITHIQLRWKDLFSSCLQLTRQFRRVGYDVVHCQADYLSGIVLPCARLSSVPVRICHVHSTRFALADSRSKSRRFAGAVLRLLVAKNANYVLGCSRAALDAFLGRSSKALTERVCVCALPLEAYRPVAEMPKAAARTLLEWPEQSKILLHVGRHSVAKNLGFVLEVFRRLSETDSRMHLMLAGEGELTQELKSEVINSRLGECVSFLGFRRDAQLLMRAADLMLFPSVFEGLPVALVEAQAVGLPILASDAITPEVEIVPDLIVRLSLELKVEEWAAHATRLLNRPTRGAKDCFSRVAASEFNLQNSLPLLLNLYGFRGVGSAPSGVTESLKEEVA